MTAESRFVALFVPIILVCASACTKAGPNLVKAKVLALTPKEYMGANVFLRGNITGAAPDRGSNPSASSQTSPGVTSGT